MAKKSIACIAIEDAKILIAHRNLVGQMGGRWEFPGGKVEPNETDEQAVTREFLEEFGVSVKVGSSIAKAEFEHNGEKFFLHAYRIFVPHNGLKEKYILTEHTEYKWVPIQDIKSFNFVDSDLLLYNEVKEYVLKNI